MYEIFKDYNIACFLRNQLTCFAKKPLQNTIPQRNTTTEAV